MIKARVCRATLARAGWARSEQWRHHLPACPTGLGLSPSAISVQARWVRDWTSCARILEAGGHQAATLSPSVSTCARHHAHSASV
ncbi:hypothetical protein Q7C36_007785 [Tachysurus vachellii]|uniref:Uncharacterized protein n=1 Tax=Tachysurus vachellii TaxID=175792 RepID=A0AA88SW39_TACVA|nr:hypothetical protein Q7C36_007785 [Tachysurus vachellii]